MAAVSGTDGRWVSGAQRASEPVCTTASLNRAIRAYWDERIVDTHPSQDRPGTLEFFRAHDAYRLRKCGYLLHRIDFDAWSGCDVLEIGCGAGLDLVRFASSGARATGVDLSATAIRLAGAYCAAAGVRARLLQADGARLPFPPSSFDLVYCHGVLAFAADPKGIVAEAWRVLRPGGQAVFMAYNHRSWMGLLHRFAGVRAGHADAPGFRMHTLAEFEGLLRVFPEKRIVGERLPLAGLVDSPRGARSPERSQPGTLQRADGHWSALLGWHLLGFCRKPS
jgi:SAM-dependent methyltransferase